MVANGLAVWLTVLITPGLEVNTDRPVLGYLILGVVFGLINAFVKPAAQFLALPFLLGSMGLVVILIDVLVFALLDAFTPELLTATKVLWIVVGGVVLGALSFIFDNVLGLTPPIVADTREEATAV